MRFFAVVVAFALLPSASHAQSSEAVTDKGRVTGNVADGVIAFKGIPYAKPPVGPLRWRAPQAMDAWTNVRNATAFSADCMQVPFPSDAAPLGTTSAEDCLYVNVWGPASPATKLPVMVWIYGGGFVNGGSSPAVYDGNQFARKGVVLVSFNYRVGRFGFFAHPALTAENKDGMLGNYAFMDQLAALRWVQHNAAAFGGDPDNVTVFGESAGGMSVHMLLTSPLASGLFQKAIIESGGGRGHSRFLSSSLPGGLVSGEAVGLQFAKGAGINGEGKEALDALRKLPAEAVRGDLNMATSRAAVYGGPMIDGKIVVADASNIYLAGQQRKVPLLIGANSADAGGVAATDAEALFNSFGEDRPAAEQAYDPNHSLSFPALRSAMGGDRGMIEPARFVARRFADNGSPVYDYRFSYVAGSMRSKWTGAPHATEIPFVFDTVKARYEAATTPADEKTGDAMLGYWVAFAKTGIPAVTGLPPWPAYTTANDTLMEFSTDGPVAKPDPSKARLDVTARYVSSHSAR